VPLLRLDHLQDLQEIVLMPLIRGKRDQRGRISGMSVALFTLLASIVVIFGSVALGRWMQRKGRDLEKGRKDGSR
jgi:hypothetical protein